MSGGHWILNETALSGVSKEIAYLFKMMHSLFYATF